jgi:hypothetical protein
VDYGQGRRFAEGNDPLQGPASQRVSGQAWFGKAYAIGIMHGKGKETLT